MKRVAALLPLLSLAVASGCSSRPVALLGTLTGAVSITSGSSAGPGDPQWPARGATVVLAGLERATEVDEAGAFSFDAVPLGPVRLVVSAPATRESVKIIDYMLDGGAAPIAVTLVGTAALVGTVRNEAGEPIASARVTVGADGTTTVTDADGHYALRTAVGTTTLLFAKEGCDPAVSPPLPLAWNQPTTFDATLPRTLALSQVDGVVRRAGKTEHAGIFVRLRGTTHSAFTDASGNFSLIDVPNGLFTLELTDQQSNGQPLNDVVENVLLSGGRVYRFTDRLEALPSLEMLPGQRIGNGDATQAIRLTADLTLLYQSGGYQIVDRKGVVRCSGDKWSGAPVSIAPNGAYLYDEGPPTADGAQQGRIVEVATGNAVVAGPLATPIGWASATELVVRLWRPDDPGMLHLVRVDATNGTQTPLQLLPQTNQSLLVAANASVFFWIGEDTIERRRLLDGTLLDQLSGSGWCDTNGCFVQPSYGANYRAYYPDGTVIDTGISYAVPSSPGYPYTTQLLFGQERFYASAQRQSYPLPPTPKSLLTSGAASALRTSSRGAWFWTQTDGLSLFRIDATGVSTMFSATATDTPTSVSGWQVLMAPDDSAAAWSAISTNGERIIHYASAKLGDTVIDCAGCEPLVVSDDGVVLASGYGVSRQLDRFDSETKTTHLLASWLDTANWLFQPNPERTRLPIQSFELEMSVVSLATGIATIVGHKASPHVWLDERTLVVHRSGIQAGYYVVELP